MKSKTLLMFSVLLAVSCAHIKHGPTQNIERVPSSNSNNDTASKDKVFFKTSIKKVSNGPSLKLLEKYKINGDYEESGYPTIDSSKIVMSAGWGKFYVYDLVTKKRGVTITVPDEYLPLEGKPYLLHKEEVHLNPKKNLLLLVSSKKYYIYNSETGQMMDTLDTTTSLEDSSYVNNPKWSPSGRYLAFQSENDRSVSVYDTEKSGNKVHTYKLYSGKWNKVRKIEWSNDEKYLSLVFVNDSVEVYQANNHEKLIETFDDAKTGFWDKSNKFLVADRGIYKVYDLKNGEFKYAGGFETLITPFALNNPKDIRVESAGGQQLNDLSELGISLKIPNPIPSPYRLWKGEITNYSILSDKLIVVDANAEFYYICNTAGGVILEIERMHQESSRKLSNHSFFVNGDKLYSVGPASEIKVYKISKSNNE